MSDPNPYQPGAGFPMLTTRADFEREFRAYQRLVAIYGLASMGLLLGLMAAVRPLVPMIQRFCLDLAGPTFGEVLGGLALPLTVSPVPLAFFVWTAVRSGRPALRCWSCRRRMATGQWEFQKVQRTGRCPHCQVEQFGV